MMKYFINASERAASGSEDYREFQRPGCEDSYWLEDSIYLAEKTFHECGLYDLWLRCMQDDLVFDMDTVNRRDLTYLQELAEQVGGTVLQAVLELKAWAEPLLTSPKSYISVVTEYDRAYESRHSQGKIVPFIRNKTIIRGNYSEE